MWPESDGGRQPQRWRRTSPAMDRRCLQDVQPAWFPGALAGWLSALENFGTWSFADVVASAIELATEGFVLDQTVATGLDMFAWMYEQWPSSAAVYCIDGRRARPGDRLVQTDLGRLLIGLAEAESAALADANGSPSGDRRRAGLEAVRRAFYEGDVAEAMVEFVTGNGGFLTGEDLADFRAEVAPAPGAPFRDLATSRSTRPQRSGRKDRRSSKHLRSSRTSNSGSSNTTRRPTCTT